MNQIDWANTLLQGDILLFENNVLPNSSLKVVCYLILPLSRTKPLFFKIKITLFLIGCMCVCVCTWGGQKKVSDPPRAGVTGSFKLPDVGAKNQTQVSAKAASTLN